MRGISFSDRLPARRFLIGSRRPVADRLPRSYRPGAEGLEPREVLSTVASPPPVVVDSVTTNDSRSVTVTYNVDTPPTASNPLVFGVYRSTDASFDPDDEPVGPGPLAPPALDDGGQPSSAVGRHTTTIPVPGGLPENPQHPYVLAVADPTIAQATADPSMVGSFRVYSIAIVTHGGIQNTSWKNGPPWELVMAKTLQAQGYDDVIPYNWASVSSDAGAAARQGPKLAAMVLDAAAAVPGGDVIDVHFIGHSEGASVNTMAIEDMEAQATPQIRAGWLHETLLDPHAANNAVKGQQYSVGRGIIGFIAGGIISHYQSEAHDPPAVVPPYVDQSEVFYQHNTAFHDRGTNDGIYNLWGDVPIKGNTTYFDLTNVGATHSGKSGVQMWYQAHIVPILGNGAPDLARHVLGGSAEGTTPSPAIDPVTNTPVETAWTHRVTFSGSATPDSTVRLLAGPQSDTGAIGHVGQTVADADGNWSITTPPLHNGTYRFLATNVQVAILGKGQLNFKPEATLGEVVVAAPGN